MNLGKEPHLDQPTRAECEAEEREKEVDADIKRAIKDQLTCGELLEIAWPMLEEQYSFSERLSAFEHLLPERE